MSLAQALIAWARIEGVSHDSLNRLTDILAGFDAAPAPGDPDKLSSEARVQSLVRLEAAQAGYWLTRNNVGAYKAPNSSRWVRYGLANESKQQNALVKSADLIGFRQRVIISTDVGSRIAQFVSRECKAEGWSYSPNDEHEQAQAAWRDFINSNGGDAAFVSGPGSFQSKSALKPLQLPKR